MQSTQNSHSAGTNILNCEPRLAPQFQQSAHQNLSKATLGWRNSGSAESFPAENDVARIERSWLIRLSRILPDSYWNPTAIERQNNGEIFRVLGVRLFKRWLPTGELLLDHTRQRVPNTGITSEIGTRDLLMLTKATKRNEIVHLVAAACFTGLSALAALRSSPGGVLAWTAVNLLSNLYPILTQRYNRARIHNLLDRKQELQSKRLFEAS